MLMIGAHVPRLVFFALLCLISSLSFGQEVQSHLLDGTEIEYVYPDEGTVVVTFYDGFVRFNWIAGPFTGANGSGFIYRARKTGHEEYLVNWQESDSHDFVTLLANFDTKKVYGS